MILSIETATQVCSVALQDRIGNIYEKRISGKGIHSEMLFLFIEELFEEHQTAIDQIQRVLISAGPGQYTGLRIGAAGVKGLLFGRNIPLYSAGTLEAFAGGLICKKKINGYVHSVIDARRNHLYHQKFCVSDEKAVSIKPPAIREISEIDHELAEGDSVIGTGLERLDKYMSPGIDFYNEIWVSADNLILAIQDERFSGWFTEQLTATFEPLYLTSGQVNNTNIHQ